jgi:sugar lactone lactonase YvrE
VALAIAAFASASGRAQTALTSTSIPQFVYDATWPKQPLPKGWIIGNVIGVAIDARDHVWILHRPATITEQERGAGFGLKTADCCFPAPPVIEFDPAGNLVQAWGGPGPGYKWVDSEHGLFVDHKDNVWVGNNQGPHLLKFTRDGKYLLTIGTPGAKPPASNDPAILGGPAPWVHPRTNELFVADGYVNRRVIVFDADTGQYKRMWGAYGGKPDDSVPWKFNPEGTDKPPSRQFQTVTGVAVSRDDLVYVADRSNNRIQVFRLDGTFVREGFILAKTPRGTVDTLAFSSDKDQQFLFDADPRDMRVWILRRSDLQPLGWLGSGGHFGGAFNSPAYLVTDSNGNLYVGEGQDGKRVQKFAYKGMTR